MDQFAGERKKEVFLYDGAWWYRAACGRGRQSKGGVCVGGPRDPDHPDLVRGGREGSEDEFAGVYVHDPNNLVGVARRGENVLYLCECWRP